MVPIQGQTHESKGDFIFSIKPLKTPPNSRVNVPLNPFFYKLLAFIKLKGPSFKGLEYKWGNGYICEIVCEIPMSLIPISQNPILRIRRKIGFVSTSICICK